MTIEDLDRLKTDANTIRKYTYELHNIVLDPMRPKSELKLGLGHLRRLCLLVADRCADLEGLDS